MAHVDTVFAAETPLEIERRGNDLVGPGVGDNAAAVIALVIGARGRSGATAGRRGRVHGRRGGPRQPARRAPRLRAARARGWRSRSRATGSIDVVNEHVGSLRARIELTGPGGHSWSRSGHAQRGPRPRRDRGGRWPGRAPTSAGSRAAARSTRSPPRPRCWSSAGRSTRTSSTRFEARARRAVGRAAARASSPRSSDGARPGGSPEDHPLVQMVMACAARAGAAGGVRLGLDRRQRRDGLRHPGGGDRVRARVGDAHRPRADRAGPLELGCLPARGGVAVASGAQPLTSSFSSATSAGPPVLITIDVLGHADSTTITSVTASSVT